MSEGKSGKAIIAESIIENFESISSYVVKQSLRDMVDENQALRDELDVYRAAVQYTFEAINKFEDAQRKLKAGAP